MTNPAKISIGVCLGTAIVIAYLFTTHGTPFWHRTHLALMPDDLFRPIVIDHFEFHTKGYAKEYQLNPKYRDFYEINISSKNGINAADFGKKDDAFDLDGKFKVELFSGSNKLSEQIVTKWESATFKSNKMKEYTSITLYNFPVPLIGFTTNDIRMKISVVEPDRVLKAYKDDIELQVRVSDTP